VGQKKAQKDDLGQVLWKWLKPPELDTVQNSRAAGILQPMLMVLCATTLLVLASTPFVDWIMPIQQLMLFAISLSFLGLIVAVRKGYLTFVIWTTVGILFLDGMASSLLDATSSVYPLPFAIAVTVAGLTSVHQSPVLLSALTGLWIGGVHVAQKMEVLVLRRPIEEGGVISGQVAIILLFGAMMCIANMALMRAFAAIDTEQERRRHLEADLYQSQKLDEIGRLAGGFAHDFNNLLSVVMVNAEFLKDETLSQSGLQSLEDIIISSESCSVLTSKLLAVGRKQVVQSKVLDPSLLVKDFASVLGHMAGPNYTLAFDYAERSDLIRVDPNQLQQILSNLVINASHASDVGTTIRVELSNVEAFDAIATRPDVVPAGAYVCLKIKDQGSGMDQETLHSAFEPFFTTKPIGEGSGLGLAVVLGVVRQSGGWVTVETEVGVGTEFCLWFPQAHSTKTWEPAPVRQFTEKAMEDYLTGAQILLVDDDDALRQAVALLLRNAGATVMDFGSGFDALNHLSVAGAFPDLFLSDVMMPEMSGPELAARLREIGYRGPKAYMTGYAGHQDVQEHLDRAELVLRKPVAAKELLSKLNQCLMSMQTKESKRAFSV
jgi:signal transduction histidine kinase/CheY-like chemotaxis protein